MKTKWIIIALLTLAGCANSMHTVRVQPLESSADVPYDKILVVSLLKTFDIRRSLEREIVAELKARGVDAIPSTSLMTTKTPMARDTYLAMVESEQPDSVMVTQIVSYDAEAKMRDARPESTYIVRPTYYYDVWSVELTEYEEPQNLEVQNTIVLATQVYSVASRSPVWGIESKLNVSIDFLERGYLTSAGDEAKSIVSHLSSDGLIAR